MTMNMGNPGISRSRLALLAATLAVLFVCGHASSAEALGSGKFPWRGDDAKRTTLLLLRQRWHRRGLRVRHDERPRDGLPAVRQAGQDHDHPAQRQLRDPLVAPRSVQLGGGHRARRVLGVPDQVHSHAAEVERHRVQLRPLDGARTSSCEGGWRFVALGRGQCAVRRAGRRVWTRGGPAAAEAGACRRDLQRPQRVPRGSLASSDGSSTRWIRTRPSGSILADGRVTRAEVEGAWEDYAQCLRAAGFGGDDAGLGPGHHHDSDLHVRADRRRGDRHRDDHSDLGGRRPAC